MYKLVLSIIAVIAYSSTIQAQDSFEVIEFPTGHTLKRNSEFTNLNCFVKFEDEFYTSDSLVITYSYLHNETSGLVMTHKEFDNSVYHNGARYYDNTIPTPVENGLYKLLVVCHSYNEGTPDKTLSDTLEMLVGDDWDRDMSVRIDRLISDSIIQGDAKVYFYLRNDGNKEFEVPFSYTITIWTDKSPNDYLTTWTDHPGGNISPGDSIPLGVQLTEQTFASSIGHKTEVCISFTPTKNGSNIDDYLVNNTSCLTMYNLSRDRVSHNRHKLNLIYASQTLEFAEEIHYASQLLLYSMNGQLMAKTPIEQNSKHAVLNKPLPKGMYQVVLSNKDGYSTSKLMVH